MSTVAVDELEGGNESKVRGEKFLRLAFLPMLQTKSDRV